MEFQPFPKMARWSRDVIITEKIDGTNAAVVVAALDGQPDPRAVWQADGMAVYAQSRSRLISVADDNFGFARWVAENGEALAAGLGEGCHFGEWWGAGIQRRYGLTEKRFSLFNVARWLDPLVRPPCCHAVPMLYLGPNEPGLMERCIADLADGGSRAAPGFMDPEGVVMYHVAGGVGFKKTVKRDEAPKGVAEAA